MSQSRSSTTIDRFSKFVADQRVYIFFLSIAVMGVYSIKNGSDTSKSRALDSAITPDLRSHDAKINHSFSAIATNLLGEDLGEKETVSRINRHDVDEVFTEAFACHDFDVSYGTTLSIGDMVIPVSGFDPDHRVGYLWIDQGILGEGFSEDFVIKYPTQSEEEMKVMSQLDRGIELFFEDEAHFLNEIFGRVRSKEESDWSRSEVDKEDIEWNFLGRSYSHRERLYEWGIEVRKGLKNLQTFDHKKEYMEIMLLEIKKELHYHQLARDNSRSIFDEWKLSAHDQIEDPVRLFSFLRSLKCIGVTHSDPAFVEVLNSEMMDIIVERDKDVWWDRSRALMSLFQANKTNGLKLNKQYTSLLTSIIKKYDYQEWPNHYHEISTLSNRLTLSKDELLALPSLAEKQGICIAPFSIRDARTIYDMNEHAYLEQLALLRGDIAASSSQEERDRLYGELVKFSRDRAVMYDKIRDEAKAKSLHKIRDDIDEFIIDAKRIHDQRASTIRV